VEQDKSIVLGWVPGHEIATDEALKKMVELAKIHAAITGRVISNITVTFTEAQECPACANA
jgi:hypothetical protein